MKVDSIHSTIETEKENKSICPITVAHSGHHGAKAFSIHVHHCSDLIHGCSQLQSSCARVRTYQLAEGEMDKSLS